MNMATRAMRRSAVVRSIATSRTARPPLLQRRSFSRAAAPIKFELPASFDTKGPAICRAVAVASPNGYRRSFGPFAEKTLECDLPARRAIDDMCERGGFTQAWAPGVSPDGFYTMTKIPVVVLVHALLGLPEAADDAAHSLTGAYGICMDPDVRTCMNVIVGRRSSKAGYVLDKFSLYYPDNAAAPITAATALGSHWDLLRGYSFRTAALNGSLNRAGLAGLRHGSIPCAPSTSFDRAKHGLAIDAASEYEDCAYLSLRQGESDAERVRRVDGMVEEMVAAYGGEGGVLALSFDPAERAAGVTALEAEWNLVKRVIERAVEPSRVMHTAL